MVQDRTRQTNTTGYMVDFFLRNTLWASSVMLICPSLCYFCLQGQQQYIKNSNFLQNMYHETSLIKKNNNIAGKLYSKTRPRHLQKGCLKDKYSSIGSGCQILGGTRRKIKCSRPTWRKERVFDKRLDFQSAQNPAFIEWRNA